MDTQTIYYKRKAQDNLVKFLAWIATLFGLFFFGTGADGLPLVGVPQPPVPPTSPGTIAAGDVAYLGEFAAGLFDLTFDESGNLVTTRRRLNQCY